MAFFSLSPTDLNEIAESDAKCDRQIRELREDSERTLATILITNNLVSVFQFDGIEIATGSVTGPGDATIVPGGDF